MIIVNQDKDEIVNFDNISNIWINNPLENDEGKFEINADDNLLGIYDTEERAKEVLEGIIQCYIYDNERKYMSRVMSIEQINMTNKSMICEMPKE